MLANLRSSETLNLLYDKDISGIVFYDTCSMSKHAQSYNDRFPIIDWFKPDYMVIFTNIIDFELREKDSKQELRERYTQYLQALKPRVKGILLLDIKQILDLYYEIFDEDKATEQIYYFLCGVAQSNGAFRHEVKKLNTYSVTFLDEAKQVVDSIFYRKEFNNMGEYSILYTSLGLRLLGISNKFYVLTDNTADVELIRAPFTDCHSEEGNKKQIQLLRNHFSPMLNDANIIKFYSTVRMLSELIQDSWNSKEPNDLVNICEFYEISKRYTSYYTVQDGERGDQEIKRMLESSFFVPENIARNLVVQY